MPAHQLHGLIGEADDGYPIELLLEEIRVPDSLDEAWIDFFDWLGRSEKLKTAYFYGFMPSTRTPGKAVARAYADHPERTGLLAILARLVAVGSPVTLPKSISLPTNQQLDSDNLRAAALLMHTVIGRWSPGEAPQLARKWLDQFGLNPDSRWLLMGIFRERRVRRINQGEALLLALYDCIITARGEGLAHVIDAMNELMRERKSGLNSRRRRNELKFPAFP